MFSKILIANRGEIACRVIKTARKMGVKTVAVYSDADRNALHVQEADEAVHIGPAAAAESYLVMDRIIEAAKLTGAQAIHPGYGFLSENAPFADLCAENDLVFIGPPADAIRSMGSKSESKFLMQAADVPTVPGYHGADQDEALLQAEAEKCGYPVLIKASAGGGGKGMRVVNHAGEFTEALHSAQREAAASFGDDRVLIEKYLLQPRHIEVQVFADNHGNAVHLFERDCSIQRRHQKVIEEAPGPTVDEAQRAAMGKAAVDAAKAINYSGAGTVEFIADSAGNFFFMEMNTRLQVEHPVTEAISGQDLVEWQLRVASGETLPATQDDLSINGHSVEVRIYAEDPDNNFMPSTGTLSLLSFPEAENVRVDTGVQSGDEVSIFYDPMIAKLITWGNNRTSALRAMDDALANTHIIGLSHNVDFLRTLVQHPKFASGDFDTGFIERESESIFAERDTSGLLIAALVVYDVLQDRLGSDGVWQLDGWRGNLPHSQTHHYLMDDETLAVDVAQRDDGFTVQFSDELACDIEKPRIQDNRLVLTVEGLRTSVTILSDGSEHVGKLDGSTVRLKRDLAEATGGDGKASDNALQSPMPGKVIAVTTEAGAQVSEGDALLVMEAMKMEHTLRAPADGTVIAVNAADGDMVEGGVTLIEFEPAEG